IQAVERAGAKAGPWRRARPGPARHQGVVAGAALRRHIAGAPATTPWCLAGPGRARRQGPAFAPALSTAWIGAWPNAAPKRAKHAAVSQMPAPRPAPRRAPAGPTRPAKGRHTGLPPPLARALPIAA
ncbi:MAG: hypothetical protein AAF486_05370, partial [Pseudomonadota bacterium]